MSPSVRVPRQTPDVSAVTIGELIGDVTRDVSTLIRQEFELATAELKQEVVNSGKAASTIGGAGFAGYMTLLFLSIALWAAQSNIMHPGRAALILAGLWALAGAVLYAIGRAQLRRVNPVPQRTVDTLKELPDALSGSRSARS
jgi:hypothetical protein